MFIRAVGGGYANLERVDELFVDEFKDNAKNNVYVGAYFSNGHRCGLAKFDSKEAAQKWLDELIEKLNAGK